jgi:hypothetical protein
MRGVAARVGVYRRRPENPETHERGLQLATAEGLTFPEWAISQEEIHQRQKSLLPRALFISSR